MNPPAFESPHPLCAQEISALDVATLEHPVTVSLEAFSGHAITGRLIDSQVHFSTSTHVSRVELMVQLDLAPPHFAPICTLPVNADYPIRVMTRPGRPLEDAATDQHAPDATPERT